MFIYMPEHHRIVGDMEIEEVKNCGGSVEGGSDVESGLVRVGDHGVMYLVWEYLTVVLPSFRNGGTTRRLLNGLSGYAEPGKITAIMGPSGSGKSTLLDALAGRLPENVVQTGNIILNGKKRRLDCGGVAYVTQENTLLGTLTVRESITFSAHLRLPSILTKEEINDIVERTITEMGLQDCSDRIIGNWHLRGISGGEKKRLSIALEILTRPSLLLLDEPTSGLDSASAFFVVQTLRNIAVDGRTVISSIHQPSSEVFALFDNLFLLSGGETVYFGEANLGAKTTEITDILPPNDGRISINIMKTCLKLYINLQFFAEAGFPCPSRRNPSDHFLRCTNSDFDLVAATLKGTQREVHNTLDPLANLTTSEIKATLVNKYRNSQCAAKAKARRQQILSIEGLVIDRRAESQASWLKQLSALTKRSFINMWRDLGYYWLRMVIYVTLSICVGSIFFDIGRSYTSIWSRGSCGAFISGFMTFMSIGGFPSFIEEMKVFCRERLNGHYGIGVYILSNFLSSFPFLTVMSLATAAITFYMVKFRPEFSHFVYICLDLTSSIAVVEGCMMTIASLVPNFLMGVIIGAGFIGIMMMTAGYFRWLPDLPKIFWRYPISYINYGAWALQGAYKNDMIGLEFDPLVPGGPKLKGEIILSSMLGKNAEHSKWWDLAAVIVILISYRLLFYAILKFKETASPWLWRLYARKTLHNLKKSPSFRKIPPFPSKRHQTIHSLSSQEGLNSPMQCK